MAIPRVWLVPLVITSTLTPLAGFAAQSHFDYYGPLLEACTRRPLTVAEKAYFAH